MVKIKIGDPEPPTVPVSPLERAVREKEGEDALVYPSVDGETVHVRRRGKDGEYGEPVVYERG